jgi:hypothetical protein
VVDRRLFRRPRALWALGLLMLALLLSQSLGLWHGVVHGPIHGASANPAAQIFSGHETQDGHEAHDGHDGAGGSPQCRLYDQCSHGDALVQVSVLALPLDLRSFVLVVLAGLAWARWHAHFQARGPPLVR